MVHVEGIQQNALLHEFVLLVITNAKIIHVFKVMLYKRNADSYLIVI